MRELWKNVLIGGAFVTAAALCSGACNPWDDGGAVLVEEVYTVKAGDTLWDAVQYLARNITWIDLNVRYIGILREKLCQVGFRYKL